MAATVRPTEANLKRQKEGFSSPIGHTRRRSSAEEVEDEPPRADSGSHRGGAVSCPGLPWSVSLVDETLQGRGELSQRRPHFLVEDGSRGVGHRLGLLSLFHGGDLVRLADEGFDSNVLG